MIGSTIAMKIKDIRNKSNEELIQELKEFDVNLFNLRSSRALAQLDKPHKFKDIHKTIARIKTVLRERGV